MATTVTFKRPDGQTIQGYLAEPEHPSGAAAIVVIQEWWGVNDQIRGVAERLASAGYIALVPDLYRGKSFVIHCPDVEIIQILLALTLMVIVRRTPDGRLEVSAPRLGFMGMSHAYRFDASNQHPIRILQFSMPPERQGGTTIFEQNTVASLDPSDRWRLFAVAARGSAVKSAQDVDLYAAQLRARRALTHIFTYDRKDWLQITRFRGRHGLPAAQSRQGV